MKLTDRFYHARHNGHDHVVMDMVMLVASILLLIIVVMIVLQHRVTDTIGGSNLEKAAVDVPSDA